MSKKPKLAQDDVIRATVIRARHLAQRMSVPQVCEQLLAEQVDVPLSRLHWWIAAPSVYEAMKLE